MPPERLSQCKEKRQKIYNQVFEKGQYSSEKDFNIRNNFYFLIIWLLNSISVFKTSTVRECQIFRELPYSKINPLQTENKLLFWVFFPQIPFV